MRATVPGGDRPGVTHQKLPRRQSRYRSARAAATTDWDAVYSGKSLADPFVGPIEARALTGKGRGLVAARDIPAGELLLVSRPLVQIAARHMRSREQMLDRLNHKRFTQHELAWLRALSTGEPEVGQQRPMPPLGQPSMPAETVGPDSQAQGDSMRRITDADIPKKKRWQMLETNVCSLDSDPILSALREQGEVLSSFGLYPEYSLLNHSCACNSEWYPIPDGMMTLIVRATKDVTQGEELTISYIGQDSFRPVADRQTRLLDNWGFTCSCPRCNTEYDPAYDRLAAEASALHSAFTQQVRPQMLAGLDAQRAANPSAHIPVVAKGLAQLRALVDGFEQQLQRGMVDGAIVGETADWLRASAFDAYTVTVELMEFIQECEAAGFPATVATKDILAYEALMLRAIAAAAPGSGHELQKAAQIYSRAKAYGPGVAAAAQAARAMVTKVLKVRYGAELKRGTMTKLVNAAEAQAQSHPSA